MSDAVDHPSHYNAGGVEVIEAIEAWSLNFSLGCVVKYVARAEHKGTQLEDLKKACWYLNREIARLQPERVPGASNPADWTMDVKRIASRNGVAASSFAGDVKLPPDAGGPQLCRLCQGELDEVRASERLHEYGDHKFKCAVSRQLRESIIVTADCDCGWQEIARG